MKLSFDKSHVIVLFVMIITFSASVVLASNAVPEAESIPFEYNILSTVSEGTTIDTTAQSKLKFHLFESMSDIFYNGEPVSIEDNSFEIDISGLSGKTVIEFHNKDGDVVQFYYFLSNSDGLLENYELFKNKFMNVYIKTYKNIKIIYTDKEKQSFKNLIHYIDELPEKLLVNVDTIKMIPYENSSKIAGVTKKNFITLYKFSKYQEQTQKNIIIHEIAHTWANKLIYDNIIDYSFSEYSNVINQDNKQVSHYAKRSTQNSGRPNEDFAESVAFFFIKPNFTNVYPNRSKYIQKLLEVEVK